MRDPLQEEQIHRAISLAEAASRLQDARVGKGEWKRLKPHELEVLEAQFRRKVWAYQEIDQKRLKEATL